VNNIDFCDDSVFCIIGDLCVGGVCVGIFYMCLECEICDGVGACIINDGYC